MEHEVCVNDVSTNTDCSYSSTNHFLEIEKGGPEKELNEFIVVNGKVKAANDPAYKKGKYISSERKGIDKFTYFELCKIKTNEVPKGNWEQTGTHCNQTNGYCSTPGKVLTGNERTKECTVGETGHYLQSVQPPWHPNHHILVLYYKCV